MHSKDSDGSKATVVQEDQALTQNDRSKYHRCQNQDTAGKEALLKAPSMRHFVLLVHDSEFSVCCECSAFSS